MLMIGKISEIGSVRRFQLCRSTILECLTSKYPHLTTSQFIQT